MNYPDANFLTRSNAISNLSMDQGIDSLPRALLIGYCNSISLSSILAKYEIEVAKNFNEAAYILQHIPTGSQQFPEIILGNYDKEVKKDLFDFARFVSGDNNLSGIPFILIEDFNTQAGKDEFEPIKGIDDIINSDISHEEFNKKIALLKKFKLLKKLHDKNGNIEFHSDRRLVYKIDSLFKRVMDILISSLTLLILSPVLLLIAIVIKIDSKGPVFYTSYRAGSNYKIFKFIKFRTMVIEADNKLQGLMGNNQYSVTEKRAPIFFKISNDPRVTRIGKFLRNTSLDELPQLINVLKADMSLVGNRPLPLYEAKVLTTDNHAERFNAPAGITGLWQISKRGQKKMSSEERIALDIDYARNYSFSQDLKIILKTPKALIQKDNV